MCQEQEHAYLDLDISDQPFEVKSALQEEENLKSKTYQDFIHTLYRFDKDNLKKVDGLFSNAQSTPSYSSDPKWTDFEQPNSFTAPDLVAPEIPEISSNRQRREIMFRPLFVYRQHLREEALEEQHEQALRSKRHHHSQDHLYFADRPLRFE